jgi:ectoine hydroxylase-related dioxygenase (phytanoyl-CoA dioxygenase family)
VAPTAARGQQEAIVNDRDRYLFDLHGYLVIPDALGADELARLNATLDDRIAREADPAMRTHRFGRLLAWGPDYRALIANPRVVSQLAGLLGPGFRLDHDYADVIRAGKGPIGTTLHGGGTPFRPAEYYHFHAGQLYNGLTVVAYNLKDVGPTDGGFACVPGSHKSNLPFPDEWRELEEPHPCVQRVTGPAGTAIVFTEALTHGTLPWRGSDERRTVFLKYSPRPLSYSARYYDADEYEELNEEQRAILEPPHASRKRA